VITRESISHRIQSRLKANPAVALLGPRQCGKTTLARALAERTRSTYFDLENPVDLARLSEPMLALEPLRGLVVIDEVQRRPDFFPVLRVLQAFLIVSGDLDLLDLGTSATSASSTLRTPYTCSAVRLSCRGADPRRMLATCRYLEN
jgi:predicted AAA+ superfamily ATPase